MGPYTVIAALSAALCALLVFTVRLLIAHGSGSGSRSWQAGSVTGGGSGSGTGSGTGTGTGWVARGPRPLAFAGAQVSAALANDGCVPFFLFPHNNENKTKKKHAHSLHYIV
jgi:hypothetical protein